MYQKHKTKSLGRPNVKGLLVGINYRGTSCELGGCINDVKSVKNLILSNYPDAKLELLTDDTQEKPTRDNILRKLTQLVNDSVAGDILIFHYSGHGSQVKDIHGDEDDGYDETICPIDFMKPRIITYNGLKYNVDSQIIDDEINEILIKVPRDAKLLMLSDSCHSGTIGDLANNFSNYNGPTIWENFKPTNTQSAAQSSVNITANNAHAVNENQHYYQLFNFPFPHNKVSTEPLIHSPTYIVYVKNVHKHQLWLTPLDPQMYRAFNQKKHIIEMSINQIPKYLLNNPWVAFNCDVNFNKLSEDRYVIYIPELGLNDIVIQISSEITIVDNVNEIKNICNVNLESSCSSSVTSNRSTRARVGEEMNSCGILSHYDISTGKHEHVNSVTGEKCTLNMRSPSSCHGGELRIISGCRDNQTSADTGRNGACTLAFLNAVKLAGGLNSFFQKIFSHNVEDLRIIQDSINKFLGMFGFTQESMVSWDHSTSNRNILGHNNYNASRVLYGYNRSVSYNYPQLSNYNIPIFNNYAKPNELNKLFKIS